MSKVQSVRVGFHGADLLNEWGDEEPAEVAELYKQLLTQHLAKAFPGAEIEIVYDLDAGGALPLDLQTCINDEYAEYADSQRWIQFEEVQACEADAYTELIDALAMRYTDDE